MKHLLVFAFALLLSGCCNGDRPPRPDRPERPERPERPGRPERPPEVPYTVYLKGEPKWDSMDDVKDFFGSKASISGTVVDLKGGAMSGRELDHPSDQQDEDSIQLRVEIKGLVLKNGVIRDIPGGVSVRKDGVKFQNLAFYEVGEDFISTPKDGAKGTVVDTCKFYIERERSGGDKGLQFNDARDVLIKNSYFAGGITAVRLQESSSTAEDVRCTAEGNTFEVVSTAFNVAGDTTFYSRRNVFIKVRTRYNLGENVSLEYQ
jgi:hypothetical protein